LNLETKFEKSLFEFLACKEKIILIFDGFDEVVDFQDIILKLLNELIKSFKLKKLIISTRNHLKRELENFFGYLSFNISALREQDCEYFLINYWSNRYRLEKEDDYVDNKNIIESSVSDFSKMMIKRLNDSVLNKFKNFIEIPLQLKMIADIYFEDFLSFIGTHETRNEIEIKIGNITELYEKFIEIKFDIKYVEKSKRIKEDDNYEYEEQKEKFFKNI